MIRWRWYDPIVLVFDYIKVLTNGQIQFLDSLSVNYLLISPCRDPCTVSWAHNVVHGFWIRILFLFHEIFLKISVDRNITKFLMNCSKSPNHKIDAFWIFSQSSLSAETCYIQLVWYFSHQSCSWELRFETTFTTQLLSL